MEITNVKIELLKPYERNVNTHPEDQIARLADLIKSHGFRDPLIVDEATMQVICGNGTLQACKMLGMNEVPCVLEKFESEEDMYAFSVSHNAIAEWSTIDMSQIHKDLSTLEPFNLDLLGFKDFQLEPDPVVGLVDEDSVPEHVEPKTRLGDLYILGNHRLLCGDSTNIQHVEKLMNGEKADMVFTDPPYGMNAVSNSGVLSKNYQSDIMNDNTTDVAKDSYRLCAGLGIPKIVFWGANYYSSALPDATCWLVWDKNNGQSDQMDCELAWTNFKGVTRQFTKASEKTNRVHPTQKPVELIQWCLDRWEAGHVLDLFGGSGSTLIACEKTNRKCFMMELDPRYCDVIVARWERFTGKVAILESNHSETI